MAKFQILPYRRAAKVKIAILHANVIAAISIVLDSERRRYALAENIELLCKNLNVTGRHLRILALTLAYHTFNLYAILASELVSHSAQVSIY